jgi:MFS transporter, DHA1 family, tetracycline resistance protein
MTAAPRKAALAFIFVTVVLDMLAIGMIAPVLPKLVLGFVEGDTSYGAQVYGLFATAFALMQFVFSPLVGALSDRFGRRPVVLMSNLGLGLDYVLMALAPSLGWLFVGRVIGGITTASYGTATAYIADVTPVERRAGAFGMLGAAFGIGFVLGPALGGVLGAMHPRLPFAVAAGLSLLNFCYGLLVLPESLPVERRAAFQWRRANPLGSLTLLRSHPELFGLSTVLFLSAFAHEVLPSTFVLYASYRYHWTERDVGLALAAVGICSAIVQAGLTRSFVDRHGARSALLFGLVCGAVGFAVYAAAPVGMIFMLAVPLTALWGLAGPSAQMMMSARVGVSEQGRLQGAHTSLRGIAGLFGPGLFTFSFAHFISGDAPLHLPGAPFALAACLLALAVVAAWRATRAQPA